MKNLTNELLYNGIELKNPLKDKEAVTGEPPYLAEPPSVICIDIGRQLFVDDFLIENTNCMRGFGKPKVHRHSPLLAPTTKEEMDSGYCPMAAPFNDGVWYDSKDR